ncbi:ABC transporter permease [Actinopolymorpha alba]|uniref:ABC transporter permease n=1 Tax=Actinopolymorpha alba TaxID=533267 RepID=UPI00037B71B2|nr:ABC transporter permease [Actinopolymorpha alba]
MFDTQSTSATQNAHAAVVDPTVLPAQEVEYSAGRRVRRWVAELVRQPGLVLSLLWVLLVIAWAAAPTVFTSYDPIAANAAHSLRGPSGTYWFGTDNLGRDLYSRVVFGTRQSMQASVVAVGLSLALGAILGMAAGYLGRWVDDLAMRVVDVLIAIPGLLLSMAVVSILGFGVTNVALAVGVAGIPGFARIIRAEVLRIKSSTYFDAAQASGTRTLAILVRHVVPNATGPVLVLAALELGGAVLSVSALSFLGYGSTPPAPEWGSLVSQGRDYMGTAWWLTTFPGLVVALTVLAANRIGRALERTGVEA